MRCWKSWGPNVSLRHKAEGVKMRRKRGERAALRRFLDDLTKRESDRRSELIKTAGKDPAKEVKPGKEVKPR